MFPSGVLPEPVAPGQTQPIPGNTGASGTSGPTGVEGTTGPTGSVATTGASGPAESGTTGSTGPATTGPAESGATGPASTGSKLTDAQLDEAGNKMEIKAGTAFKFVRDENSTLKTELAEAKRKLSEQGAQSGPVADPVEVKALKDKVERYEKALAVSNVRATDDFQNNIEQPLVKAKGDLKAIVDKYKVAEGELAAALSNPDENARTDKLAEMSAAFNRLDLIKFDQLIVKIGQLSEQEKAVLSEASEKYRVQQQKAETDAAAAQSMFAENWKSALETAGNKLEKEGFFKPTGDATRDAELKKAQDAVKNLDVAKLSNEDLAEQLYRGQAFPILMSELADALANLGAKDQEITRLRGGTPGPGAANQLPAQTGATGVPQDASFKDVVKTKLAGVLPP